MARNDCIVTSGPTAAKRVRRRERRLECVPALSACLLAFQTLVAWAETRPWIVNKTDFGPTAIGVVDGGPTPRLATEYNINAVGLFCGVALINPGKINFYLHGIDYDRSVTGEPLKATVVVDGNATDLTFGWWYEHAVVAISADFTRKLMAARSLSVLVKDYNSAKPDIVNMDGSAVAIRTALRRCIR